ncbi:MAG: DMT family transporter [Spirochaetota bacterium]
MDRKRISARVCMLFAMLFYGASFPITKSALEVFGPITIVTARLVISSVVLLSVNIAVHGKAGLPVGKHWILFVLIALFQPLGYFLFETFGLQHVSAAVASIMIATIPVFTPVFSRFFISERLTLFNIAGLGLSFVGVVILVAADQGSSGNARLIGILLMFGAVFSAVFYTILVKKLPISYSPLTVTAVQNTLGLLLFIPLFFIFEYDSELLSNAAAGVYGIEPILSIVFLAIFASSLAFIFLNFGIQVIGPSKANGFTNLIPVITAVVSFLFFGETFTLQKAVGIAVVFLGVLLAQYSRSHRMVRVP